MAEIATNIKNKQRVDWIDIGKGISMIVVMLYHSEIYFNGEPTTITSFLIPPLMNFFFFLSGFFFLKSGRINVKGKLIQIIKTIIIPYLIFTSVIFIPKALKYGDDISIMHYVHEVLLGQASWFVMALMIGQILMIFVSMIKPKSMILVGVISYLMYMVLSPIVDYQPYYYLEGIRALLFLVLGLLYYRNKDIISNIFVQYNTIQYNTIISILLFAGLYFTHGLDLIANDMGVIVLTSSLVGLHLFSVISKGIETCGNMVLTNSLISIGKNSLIYYFLNGGIISVLVIIANKLVVYSSEYTYAIWGLTIVLISILVKLILKYCPIIVGRK